MTRREFLAAGAAVGAAAALDADEPKLIPIVDTHQHLWDLKKFRLNWITKDSPLNHSFMLPEYAQATEGLKVVKSVYMEVDLAAEQQQAEADFVIDLCASRKTTTVAAVVSGRPDQDNFKKYAAQFRDHRYVKGLRRILHGSETPQGHCLKKEFITGIRLLGELGLSFDLCMRPAELPDATKLIDACPDTRFILDHCGNEDVKNKEHSQWQKDISDLASRKNVVGKVSGIVVTAKPKEWTAEDLAPVVNHTLNAFGSDRVMFGGDWPVCTQTSTYRQWVEALKLIVKDREEADQRKLLHDNAVRFYGLK